MGRPVAAWQALAVARNKAWTRERPNAVAKAQHAQAVLTVDPMVLQARATHNTSWCSAPLALERDSVATLLRDANRYLALAGKAANTSTPARAQ